MQTTEKIRKEIGRLKGIIARQEKYLEESNRKSISELNGKIRENKETLNKLLDDFEQVVTEFAEYRYFEFIKWINAHKKTIVTIKNFIKSPHFERKIYTEERLKIISEIYASWTQFADTKQLPETHLLPDYEIFYEILQYKTKLKDRDIPVGKIEEIEKLRQEITALSKKQFYNDAVLDKGSAWGATNEIIDKAEQDYKIISSKTAQKEKALDVVIYKTELTEPEVIEKWIFIHGLTCVSIIMLAFTSSADIIQKDSTRLFVADETFYLWKNLSRNDKRYIIPNTYYLSDYDLIFNKILHSDFMRYV